MGDVIEFTRAAEYFVGYKFAIPVFGDVPRCTWIEKAVTEPLCFKLNCFFF